MPPPLDIRGEAALALLDLRYGPGHSGQEVDKPPLLHRHSGALPPRPSRAPPSLAALLNGTDEVSVLFRYTPTGRGRKDDDHPDHRHKAGCTAVLTVGGAVNLKLNAEEDAALALATMHTPLPSLRDAQALLTERQRSAKLSTATAIKAGLSRPSSRFSLPDGLSGRGREFSPLTDMFPSRRPSLGPSMSPPPLTMPTPSPPQPMTPPDAPLIKLSASLAPSLADPCPARWTPTLSPIPQSPPTSPLPPMFSPWGPLLSFTSSPPGPAPLEIGALTPRAQERTPLFYPSVTPLSLASTPNSPPPLLTPSSPLTYASSRSRSPTPTSPLLVTPSAARVLLPTINAAPSLPEALGSPSPPASCHPSARGKKTNPHGFTADLENLRFLYASPSPSPMATPEPEERPESITVVDDLMDVDIAVDISPVSDQSQQALLHTDEELNLAPRSSSAAGSTTATVPIPTAISEAQTAVTVRTVVNAKATGTTASKRSKRRPPRIGMPQRRRRNGGGHASPAPGDKAHEASEAPREPQHPTSPSQPPTSPLLATKRRRAIRAPIQRRCSTRIASRDDGGDLPNLDEIDVADRTRVRVLIVRLRKYDWSAPDASISAFCRNFDNGAGIEYLLRTKYRNILARLPELQGRL